MESVTKHVLMQLIIILLAIIVLAVLFFVGIFIGYVILGKGQSSDAFNPDTWNHILDFIN